MSEASPYNYVVEVPTKSGTELVVVSCSAYPTPGRALDAALEAHEAKVGLGLARCDVWKTLTVTLSEMRISGPANPGEA